ncbi:hypothetical protein G0Q06_08790 [Puniceicoccales bacterium CK1056]|uniref:Alkaline shock response membrane anchor protein AmaP n=1 Tax=Oceanipulchritudo coccoides TaxID=2706888 RepID=A0A6B2M3Z3_9BACT|nr:hypothetical protein [Oceanipulchritudo coccoides]NDV62545.1 hypothetical protein [Oceanipulchritudo coccoides]
MKTTIESLEHLLRVPYLYYAAVAVVLLVALYLFRSYRRANQGIVPFKTQGGTIEIAPQTLRSVMQNAANSVEGIDKAACRHFMKGRNVGVKVAVHLRANHRLKDVETMIKQRIRATLLDQFGMETVDPIHIRVTRIVGDPVASVPKDSDSMEALPGDEFEDETIPRDSEDDRPYSDDTRL